MGEVSGGTVKLSKYLLSPNPPSSAIWLQTLLSTLQYAAASHGQRRFLLRPSPNPSNEAGVEVWLFSRAKFTTSLGRLWETLGGHNGHGEWKGYRIFFRPPSTTEDQEGLEVVEMPEAVWRWTKGALEEVEGSLPAELKGLMGKDWGCGYLVNHAEESVHR